jgi:hypothetical protein
MRYCRSSREWSPERAAQQVRSAKKPMRSLLSPVCLPVPGYAIDDQTAIKVTDGAVEVVSEGHWKLFTQE